MGSASGSQPVRLWTWLGQRPCCLMRTRTCTTPHSLPLSDLPNVQDGHLPASNQSQRTSCMAAGQSLMKFQPLPSQNRLPVLRVSNRKQHCPPQASMAGASGSLDPDLSVGTSPLCLLIFFRRHSQAMLMQLKVRCIRIEPAASLLSQRQLCRRSSQAWARKERRARMCSAICRRLSLADLQITMLAL